jgi:hypothetical protein
MGANINAKRSAATMKTVDVKAPVDKVITFLFLAFFRMK